MISGNQSPAVKTPLIGFLKKFYSAIFNSFQEFGYLKLMINNDIEHKNPIEVPQMFPVFFDNNFILPKPSFLPMIYQ